MEHSSAEEPVSASQESAHRVALEDLECPICLSLMCEPLTLSCGHSACRMCYCRSLERVPKCPTCRAVCHISPEDHPETLVISQLAKRCFPALYEQRLREVEQERESLALLLPIFFYNVPMFPGETLRLHLFEPRYKLMMQRIVNSTRRFAYVPNYNSYKAKVGDVALIAELKEVAFMRDGCSELEAKIAGRYTIVEQYVEEATGGLHYCRVKELKDGPTPTERRQEVSNMCRQAKDIATRLFLDNREIKAIVLDRFGDMPLRCPVALSLWLTALLRTLSREEKHSLLQSTDTGFRLQTCLLHLHALLEAAESKAPRGHRRGREQETHSGAEEEVEYA